MQPIARLPAGRATDRLPKLAKSLPPPQRLPVAAQAPEGRPCPVPPAALLAAKQLPGTSFFLLQRCLVARARLPLSLWLIGTSHWASMTLLWQPA